MGADMNSKLGQRLDKVYEGLSNREKANLAFGCVARADKAGAERIDATLSWKTYRALDLDFFDRVHRLGDFAFFWAVQYWRTKCATTAALGLVARAWAKEDDRLTEQALGMLEEAEGRLLALLTMLDEICQAHGVDKEAVLKIAGAERDDEPIAMAEEPVQDEETDEIRRLLTMLVE
jgi:hypothetical protein